MGTFAFAQPAKPLCKLLAGFRPALGMMCLTKMGN